MSIIAFYRKTGNRIYSGADLSYCTNCCVGVVVLLLHYNCTVCTVAPNGASLLDTFALLNSPRLEISPLGRA